MKGKRFLAAAMAAVLLAAQPVYGNEIGAAFASETTENDIDATPVTLYCGETQTQSFAIDKEMYDAGLRVEYTNPDICDVGMSLVSFGTMNVLMLHFDAVGEGETDALIYDSEGTLIKAYRVTAECREQTVYLSMPTDVSVAGVVSELVVDDPEICTVEKGITTVNSGSGYTYDMPFVSITGEQKGTTYIKGYDANQTLQFARKVTVEESPEDLVTFADANLRRTLLGIFMFGTKCDADENGYISKQELEKVTSITVAGCGIRSLDGLQEATNLRFLNTNNNQELSDISALLELENLETVSINNTAVSEEDQLRLMRIHEELTLNKGTLGNYSNFRSSCLWKVTLTSENPLIEVISGQEYVESLEQSKLLKGKEVGDAVVRVSLGDSYQDITVHVDGIDADQPLGEISDMDMTTVASGKLLDSSSRLWQTYPEASVERENVSQYVSGYVYTKSDDADHKKTYAYAIDEDGNLWADSEKKAEQIVAAQGRYALTDDGTLLDLYRENPADVENVKLWAESYRYRPDEGIAQGITFILKEDGSLWYRWEGTKEESAEDLIRISDNVIDMGNTWEGFYFLRENGEYCEFSYDWSSKEYGVTVQEENVAAMPEDGIYRSMDGETFVWDNYQYDYINVGKKDVTKVVNISPWNAEGYYDLHETYCLLNNGDVYRFIDGAEEQLVLTGVKDLAHCDNEEQKGSQCLYMGEDGLWRTMDGTCGSPENPLRITECYDMGWYVYEYDVEDCGIASSYNLTQNGVVLLTHVKNVLETYDESTQTTYIYVTRTDGTVWRVEEDGIPEKIIDLNEKTDSAEMTEEQKQETVDQITAAEEKGTVSVDMESAVILPKDVLEAAQEKEVTLECTLSDGTTWEIDGSALVSEEGEELVDLDLSVVRTGKEDGAISSDTIDEIAGQRTVEQLNFTNGGSGIAAALTLAVDAFVAEEPDKPMMKCVAVSVNVDDGETKELLGVSLIVDQKMKLPLSQVKDCALVYAVNGDTSGDGEVNLTDLMQTLHHVSGRNEFEVVEQGISDVDLNGNTNLTDLMRTLHYVSGRRETL